MSEVKRYKMRGDMPASAIAFLPDEVVSASDYDRIVVDKDVEIARMVEALKAFISCTYPVHEVIHPRGYNWSVAYLDQALPIAEEALASWEAKR